MQSCLKRHWPLLLSLFLLRFWCAFHTLAVRLLFMTSVNVYILCFVSFYFHVVQRAFYVQYVSLIIWPGRALSLCMHLFLYSWTYISVAALDLLPLHFMSNWNQFELINFCLYYFPMINCPHEGIIDIHLYSHCIIGVDLKNATTAINLNV